MDINVDALLARTEAAGIAATRLPVSHAFHSPLVAAAAEPLAAHLDREELRRPSRTVVSTVTGRPLEAAGWIRAGAGDDARQTRWSLTPAGRRKVGHATPAWERAQNSLRTRLGATQWGRLLSELATVASAARADA